MIWDAFLKLDIVNAINTDCFDEQASVVTAKDNITCIDAFRD